MSQFLVMQQSMMDTPHVNLNFKASFPFFIFCLFCNRGLNRGCLVYMFSFRFSGVNF